jgi:hypothetical protein
MRVHATLSPSSPVRERDRKREVKREGERERERERERIILFLKGLTGALAPFSYLVKKYLFSKL